MFNLDNITEKDNNKDWPYRKLIIVPSGTGKTNYLLNSIQRDNSIVDKIYSHAKDLEEPKCKLLIDEEKKLELVLMMIQLLLLSILILWMIFLIIFYDMISHVISDEKAQQILKDLFIRCRKLNVLLCFLTLSYFSVPKSVTLNCTHYILLKLNNKRELQNIAINHSADIDYKDFIKIYRDCTK